MASNIRDWFRGRSASPKDPSTDQLLPEVINQSGRAPLTYFLQLAESSDEAQFAARIRCPLLIGWAIREGALSVDESSDPLARMKGRTMAFKPAELFAMARRSVSRPSESLQEAIYPLTKGAHAASRDILTYEIGRSAGNDLVIPDFTISKKHARIELAHHEYYLRDLGSRNGTAVNDVKLREPVKLSYRDKVCFARYEFAFVSPELLYRLLLKRALQAAGKR